MAKCDVCGLPVGIFSKRHKTCEPASDHEEVSRKIDIALNSALRAARSNAQMPSASMPPRRAEAAVEAPEPVEEDAAVEERPIRIEDLSTAIAQNQFVLHFQPKIEISSGNIVGVEALVRWQHPEYGLIFPDEFIPRAEEFELIDQLGWIIIRQGLADVGKLTDQSGVPLKLSINLSMYALYEAKFLDKLLMLLEMYSVDAENLIFEISEDTLVDELSSMVDVLNQLRSNRVRVSIDDFGTGSSIIRQLRRISATELKIDMPFIQGMLDNNNDRILVDKIIEIGHELGMKVVAEGVETREQLAFLRSRGCDIAQGYYFSPPLPIDRLLEWLLRYRDYLSGQTGQTA
jgi:EAL domain-containing protein (putative c-di-GMP-specific phosphodiesterase class I)